MTTTSLFGSHLGDYYMKLSLGKYFRPTPFAKSDWKKDTVIILPLPSSLSDHTSVLFNNVDLGVAGDIVNNGKNNSGTIATAAFSLTDSLAAKIDKVMPTATSKILDPEKIITALEQTLGVAPNPNSTVTFQGPSLREFSFSWLLQPRNKTESDKVQRIVKTIKSKSLPMNDLAGTASVLKYPSLCQINFYPWDSKYSSNEYGWGDNSIIKIKRCFLSDVNIQYNPSNVPAFFEGSQYPVAIQLDITFKEVEYMMANDWDESAIGKDNLETLTKDVFAASSVVGNNIYDSAGKLKEYIKAVQ